MKIAKFFLDKATYKVISSKGEINMEIDYWNNKFKLSAPDKKLEKIAKHLLSKKHRINFAWKFQGEPAGGGPAGIKK